jgi:polyvinyl alcohol dehydrogenase (cytochrome)
VAGEEKTMKRAQTLFVFATLSVLPIVGVTADAPPEAAPDVFATLRGLDYTNKTEVGYMIFQVTCIRCHGNPAVPRAPSQGALMRLSAQKIYDSLNSGEMAPVVGSKLSEGGRRAVAESLSGQRLGNAALGEAAHMPNRCTDNPEFSEPANAAMWNGWGADTANSRFQPASAAGLDAKSISHLTLRWAFGFPNSTSAYAQTAVRFGRLYVGTDTGFVYSLNARSGCVYWSFKAKDGVRTAMTLARIGTHAGKVEAVFFGDRRGNLYAVDARRGRALWSTHVAEHFTQRITAAPTYYKGRLYVPISSWEEIDASDLAYECCRSVGAVASVNANTGRVIWKTPVIPGRPKPLARNEQGVQQWGPAGGSVWNSPTIDPLRKAVYFGTGDGTTYPAAPTTDAVVALDLKSGRVLWSHQVYTGDSFLGGCSVPHRSNCPKVVGPDFDIPASPVLVALPDGQRRLIVGTKPGDVLALDPDKGGAVVWKASAPERKPTAEENSVVPVAGILWGFSVDQEKAYFGLGITGVVALKLTSGERAWTSPLDSNRKVSYWSANTSIPGVVLQGGSDGRIYALSSADGHVLWTFETARDFETVNHVKARGGSIIGGGPVAADGMVFVGSGYAVLGGTPGNVLLAFAPE